ncbi:MAG: KTSC domain-containing protein [Janthinobacterium lividum]
MPSSVVQWMHYDPHSCSLLIAFRGGRGLYRYFDVPASAWESFRVAPSKGTHLNTIFKDGGFGYERLDASAAGSLHPHQDTEFWGDLL